MKKTAAQKTLEAEVIQAINNHFMGADAKALAADASTRITIRANLEQDSEFEIKIERVG